MLNLLLSQKLDIIYLQTSLVFIISCTPKLPKALQLQFITESLESHGTMPTVFEAVMATSRFQEREGDSGQAELLHLTLASLPTPTESNVVDVTWLSPRYGADHYPTYPNLLFPAVRGYEWRLRANGICLSVCMTCRLSGLMQK